MSCVLYNEMYLLDIFFDCDHMHSITNTKWLLVFTEVSKAFLRNVQSQIRAIFTINTLTDFVRELDRHCGNIPQHFICAYVNR